MWDETVVYVGCEDIQIPKAINFEIYGDSIIDLNTFDSRIPIKLKFNWLYEGEWPNKLGVASIDIIKGDSVISNMDLSYLELEAFMNKYPESKRFEQIVRDDIYLVDENYDSYLDFTIQWNSRGFTSYWIYNPDKEIFEFKKELNYMRPYYVDCNENLIYSFQGGTAWYYDSYAYKINNGQIEFYQSLYHQMGDGYRIERYKDANDSIIFTDTIYHN